MQARLGDVIQHNGRPCRIVRIIDKSYTLVEYKDNKEFIIEETYAQLKDASGNIDFLEIYVNALPYTGEHHIIKALDSLPSFNLVLSEEKNG